MGPQVPPARLGDFPAGTPQPAAAAGFVCGLPPTQGAHQGATAAAMTDQFEATLLENRPAASLGICSCWKAAIADVSLPSERLHINSQYDL